MELPDAARWKRFEHYSLRVRRLVYNHTASPEKILQRIAFDDVARTRIKLNILPNMHTLIWKGPLCLSVMFMHAGVKSFDIWLPDDLEEVSPQPFFQDIVERMPNITNLSIRSYVAVKDVEPDLANLISRLIKLHTVTFPQFYLTSKITEALSVLPNLNVIEFQYLSEQGFGNVDDVMPYTPDLTENAFPTLWDYSLTAAFDDLTRFFNLEFAPTNLTSLYIDSFLLETTTSIHRLLSIVADTCQMLKLLALVSIRDVASVALADDAEQYSITFNHLKPILKLANLRSLEILHHYPLALKEEDTEIFAASWPSLESLILNDEPVLLKESNLTAAALLPFARHCPDLIRLGLFLDTSSIETLVTPFTTLPFVPFKRLKHLSMGVSIIKDENLVALYLSHVLPLGCTIDSGITWEGQSFSDGDEVHVHVTERCDRWAKVNNLLPILTRLRTEEKGRLQAMEREIYDLRMRNEILGECTKLGLSPVSDKTTCIIT